MQNSVKLPSKPTDLLPVGCPIKTQRRKMLRHPSVMMSPIFIIFQRTYCQRKKLWYHNFFGYRVTLKVVERGTLYGPGL